MPGVAEGGPATTRLAVTFRLLLLLRGMLLAMAVVLRGSAGPGRGLWAAIALLGLETALALAAWRPVLRLVRRLPPLCCLDALLVFAVLVQGGVFGPFFLFTVMTAALAGVLYAWGPVLLVCVAQIALCFAAMGTASPAERHDPGLLIALPAWIRTSPDRAERDARDILSALRIAAREARGLIADLREEAYGLPLPAAVGHVAAGWSETAAVPVEVAAEGSPGDDIPVAVRYEIVSVLKEALTNVERHARAGRVEIRLVRSADGLELSVRDDGAGFVPPDGGRLDLLAREGHYGVVGMAERARRAGGRLCLRSAPGHGTTVTITVPRASWPAGDAAEPAGTP
ncbi:sensor histidine kinase [Spirillospora sp. CA-128828]|uniref:sensor histidine kinase n=1 Tax=Spirillospora sp. CA-128828 TaxID=3240033 RepID=UPI003D9205A5